MGRASGHTAARRKTVSSSCRPQGSVLCPVVVLSSPVMALAPQVRASQRCQTRLRCMPPTVRGAAESVRLSVCRDWGLYHVLHNTVLRIREVWLIHLPGPVLSALTLSCPLSCLNVVPLHEYVLLSEALFAKPESMLLLILKPIYCGMERESGTAWMQHAW